MFALAFGDALGKPTEFLDVEQITRRFGPGGPADLPEPALVTDDTQMALAVGEALVEVLGDAPPTAELFAPVLARRFVQWASSPENNRAPGMTCLRSCGGLAQGQPWVSATQPDSKGCGANMRVTPVGLVPGLADPVRAGLAQLQAALTHGHPTGLAASELTAFATWWLNDGLDPARLLPALRDRCREQRAVYREDWLGGLWARGHDASPAAFIARGWDECLAALDTVAEALADPDDDADPCAATGDGWVAQEALATALHCFLRHPGEPVRVLRRAACTRGDSDSIAALAGAFAGAWHGIEAFAPDWVARIEYRERLRALGAAWDAPAPAAASGS